MIGVFYAHGGSENHGCEAIIRSTNILLNDILEKQILLSYQINEDKEYKLDNILELRQEINSINRASLDFIKAYLYQKFKGNYHLMDSLLHKKAIEGLTMVDMAFFVGGDNYCYSDVKNYMPVNSYMRKKAKKMILWGTSVEPSLLSDKEIVADIQNYDKIIARESISYEALKQVNDNIALLPDPAFYLPDEKLELSQEFLEGNITGINISPLILEYEQSKGQTLRNYENLIEYILKNSDDKIALIPHVVWKNNDDRKPLSLLYEKYKNTSRVIMIEDHNCMQQKYIISHCDRFIGARTHATIAAYSTNVPTVVVGYSVKARGIAKDLFGTEENYVLPVQRLDTSEQLQNAYKWLVDNGEKIKQRLESKTIERDKIKGEFAKVIQNG